MEPFFITHLEPSSAITGDHVLRLVVVLDLDVAMPLPTGKTVEVLVLTKREFVRSTLRSPRHNQSPSNKGAHVSATRTDHAVTPEGSFVMQVTGPSAETTNTTAPGC